MTLPHTTTSATRSRAMARLSLGRTALLFPTAALRSSPTRSMATLASSLMSSTRGLPSTPSTLPPPTRPPPTPPPPTPLNIKCEHAKPKRMNEWITYLDDGSCVNTFFSSAIRSDGLFFVKVEAYISLWISQSNCIFLFVHYSFNFLFGNIVFIKS